MYEEERRAYDLAVGDVVAFGLAEVQVAEVARDWPVIGRVVVTYDDWDRHVYDADQHVLVVHS